ncbi:universal stress protein UspA [Halobellus ruber]|uniref:Universal stress protein UspA n=1 Tax=Halobellus ruber TaxID=2761102 RepID=A0A7J9SL98_9EURY|nr:universal stress protein UspA [Halobellus ruber]MBB6647292.1 universal stress protein UspA [Halobellus ruber]
MSTSYRVLIPFDLPDADPVPSMLIKPLATTEVVALGQYKLPEQTPPGAAREQFEGDARDELADLVRPLERAEVPTRTRLVFSSDRQEAINRVAREDGCDAILTTGEADTLDRLFVALGGKPDRDRILSFVADLLAATDASVTLFHTSEETLTNATDRLVERGIDPDRAYQHLSESSDVGQRVVELETECDLLVVGEPDPSRDVRVLEPRSTEMTLDTDDPAFVIRGPD